MKRIGEILIENGSITAAQLEAALQFQKKAPGKLIGKILIELGYLTEEEIVIALSTQFNVPYLPLANFAFNESNEKLIPKELIVKYLCVPLERIGNLLTVVMSDPTNEEAIRAIEASTKAKVQTFVATSSEIMKVLEQYFHIDASSVKRGSENMTPSIRNASHNQPKTVQKP